MFMRQLYTLVVSAAVLAAPAFAQLFIADSQNNRIRAVSTSGTITTAAGNGTGAFAGDGGAATSAELHTPYGVATDLSGNLYIADQINNRAQGNGGRHYQHGGRTRHSRLWR